MMIAHRLADVGAPQPQRVHHVCAQPLPGLGAGYDAALMYHAMVDCGYGIPCPPYVQGKELSCVVCTK